MAQILVGKGQLIESDPKGGTQKGLCLKLLIFVGMAGEFLRGFNNLRRDPFRRFTNP